MPTDPSLFHSPEKFLNYFINVKIVFVVSKIIHKQL